MSIREKLLDCAKPRYGTIEVPGVGSVRIKSLSARETFALVDRIQQAEDQHEQAAIYIAACTVDDEGNPLFGDSDLEELSNIDAQTLMALHTGILKHVGLLSFEAAEKNSEETP